MITGMLVDTLLQSAVTSLGLLEKLQAKFDAQATGKLRGAFRSLRTACEQSQGASVGIQMALASFTESAEYFQSMAASVESESPDRTLERKPAVRKILGWGRFAAGSVRDLVGLGEGQLNQLLRLDVERINYINLQILSEVGRIACMAELGYGANTVSRDLERLRATKFGVDPEFLLERAVHLGVVPSRILKMQKAEFEQQFGAAVKHSDLHPLDDREDTRQFIVGNYGTTISAIKKNDPAYAALCRAAGREPRSLDDYVDMVLARESRNEDFLDRLAGWGEKKLLYWADEETMRSWAQIFFQYAALKTLLERNHVPRQLLSAVESGALSGAAAGPKMRKQTFVRH